MPAEVHPVSRAKVLPQLEDPIANGLAVPDDFSLQTLDAQTNLGLRPLAPKRAEPFAHRLLSVAALLAEDFHRLAAV